MNPYARERRYKSRAILAVLSKFEEYSNLYRGAMKTTGNMDAWNLSTWEEKLAKFCDDFMTLDRYWRQILQQREDLRGEDYNDKKVLAQEKQLELGYTPGFNSDIKKGSEL